MADELSIPLLERGCLIDGRFKATSPAADEAVPRDEDWRMRPVSSGSGPGFSKVGRFSTPLVDIGSMT